MESQAGFPLSPTTTKQSREPKDMQEIHKENFIKAGIPVHIDWLKKPKGCLSYEFAPKPNSPLRIQHAEPNTNVFVRRVSQMGAYVATHHRREVKKVNFFKESTSKRLNTSNITLENIGANESLFTLSCLNTECEKTTIHCHEADAINYKYLQLNLEHVPKEQKRLINAPISDKNEKISFYTDSDNTGNHTLDPNSMVGRERCQISVTGIDVRAEYLKWISDKRPIFLKCDTQGFDETIISANLIGFWEKHYGEVFEIRRIKGKNYPKENLASILDNFKKKISSKNPKKNLSTRKLLGFIEGTSEYLDLDICSWN